MTFKRPARKRPAPTPASAPKPPASIPMSAVEKVEYTVLDRDGDGYGRHENRAGALKDLAMMTEGGAYGPYRIAALLYVNPDMVPPSAEDIAEAWSVLRRAGEVE